MRYNPDIHRRRSIRLSGYDYSKDGAYFITICTRKRECILSEIDKRVGAELASAQEPSAQEPSAQEPSAQEPSAQEPSAQEPSAKHVGAELASAQIPESICIHTQAGKIVERTWINLSKRYSRVITDEYVIMPNHFHGIVMIMSENRCSDDKRAEASSAPTIGRIVQSFKSICVTDYLKHIKENNLEMTAKIWQKNYYERIIRNENELERIREYIRSNPHNWENDGENPANIEERATNLSRAVQL